MVERVPYPDRNRIVRLDGTLVFLCDDCRAQASAGQLGAFSDGSLLRLREYAPLFGIDIAPDMKSRARPVTKPKGTAQPKPKPAPPAPAPAHRVRPVLGGHRPALGQH